MFLCNGFGHDFGNNFGNDFANFNRMGMLIFKELRLWFLANSFNKTIAEAVRKALSAQIVTVGNSVGVS